MIAEAIKEIRQRIDNAMVRSGRVDKVMLLAVTKNHPVEAIEEAARAGITNVGENRVQEVKRKAAEYNGEPIDWHLIGHLQTNKVRQAVPLVEMIHSVDSERVIREIDRVARNREKVQRILLQVNVAREESKSGLEVEELPEMIELAKTLPNVRVEGLMCMAPYEENPEVVRPIFRVAACLFEDMKRHFEPGQIKYLSMGMSHDFEVAIEEGANIVRVGTSIFGQRDYSRN